MYDSVAYSTLPDGAPQLSLLSSREREVLSLIVQGQTNAQIAATLYLSPNTVKTHVRHIFSKLGVEHRLQAAVLALQETHVMPLSSASQAR